VGLVYAEAQELVGSLTEARATSVAPPGSASPVKCASCIGIVDALSIHDAVLAGKWSPDSREEFRLALVLQASQVTRRMSQIARTKTDR
jgi:hypothetical protein